MSNPVRIRPRIFLRNCRFHLVQHYSESLRPEREVSWVAECPAENQPTGNSSVQLRPVTNIHHGDTEAWSTQKLPRTKITKASVALETLFSPIHAHSWHAFLHRASPW